MPNTKLTKASSLDVDDIIFQKPSVGNIPNSSLTYKRINLSVKNPDGSVGDLVLETERLFTFGVQENKNPDGAANGFVMPLCLWTRDNPSPEELQWTEKFNEIVEVCKDYILENKDELEKYDLERSDLKKLNPLYWKKEKGKVVEGRGPTLYCRLLSSKKDGSDKILTGFYDEESGDPIDPLQIFKQYCHARCAIKIESIFIGSSISLQVKMWEADVSVAGGGRTRLLGNGNKVNATLSSTVIEVEEDSDLEEDNTQNPDNEDAGSISDSDEEVEVVEKKRKVPKSRKAKK